MTASGNLGRQFQGNPDQGTVECDECGQRHTAEYSHQSTYGKQRVYAVVCDKSPDIVDYYTEERVSHEPFKDKSRPTAKDLGLS
jgi:hypothetical protein